MKQLLAAAAAIAALSAGAPAAAQNQAREASPANAEARPVSQQDRVVCKTKGMSGTRVRARKICGSQRDWDKASSAAKTAVDEVRNGARGACTPGQPCSGG